MSSQDITNSNRNEAAREIILDKFGNRKKVICNDGTIIFFQGTNPDEYIKEIHYTDGRIDMLNLYGELTKTVYPDNVVYTYTTSNGKTSLNNILYPNGDNIDFMGSWMNERKVCLNHFNGAKTFYDGDRGEEYKTKHLCVNGTIKVYKGLKGKECKFFEKTTNGTKKFYEGSTGNEHMIRKILPCGTQEFYEGLKGSEYMIRKILPDGTQEFYKGLKGCEYMIHKIFPDGTREFYKEL